jgi:glutamate racemase
MSSSRPIGIFDSGIGGLTVVHEIMRQLPHERVVYVGDTARVPYGPKSPDTVRRYARQITRFLLEQDVKAVVVACNTATAHALEELRSDLEVPVVGVIEPGARAAVTASGGGSIGVIGTAGTIRSGAYERAIRALDPDAEISVRACPLFVPLVEEGWTDHPVTRAVAREYLAPLCARGISALVLGCTHYPLLKTVLRRTLGSRVALIDSAAETAAEVGRVLRQYALEAPESEQPPAHRFVASDDPMQFLDLGQRFLGDAIERVDVHTFA